MRLPGGVACSPAGHFVDFDERLDRKGEPAGSPPVLELRDSYLVDPASSHMLVSKIKPCMSKYKQICTVKLRMAH
jgi:hypothetical protein